MLGRKSSFAKKWTKPFPPLPLASQPTQKDGIELSLCLRGETLMEMQPLWQDSSHIILTILENFCYEY